MKSLTLALAALALAGPAFALSTVKLKNGSSLQGEILLERADRVVIDLGITVVTVPRDEVERISSGTTVVASVPEEASDMYRTASTQPVLTVKENVTRVGEAVVQVRTPSGLGSGFVIQPNGYVLTNEHVVSGEYTLTVTFFRKGPAGMSMEVHNKVRVVAMDAQLDIALLKIEDLAEGVSLPTVPVGDSDGLTEGQPVFAIGSPLGLDRTVSQGIISSRNRPLGGHLYIQTTTQINPGNSGGPLFNLRGEVVGMNNMKPMMAGIEGLNFAIPSSVLKTFLKNRDAYAFDARNPNAGYRYLSPPQTTKQSKNSAAAPLKP